jgi:anaerobic ribonucleoside-triphosphate reductase activating protein
MGRDVVVYTGFTLEELRSMEDAGVTALLDNTDLLVDGPFVLAERDLTLTFRGSRNQRLIDLRAERKNLKTAG